jgi:hypothetical protein
MIKTKDLPKKVRRFAVDSFTRSLNTLAEPEQTAVVHILNALADLPPERAAVALAMAKLATMPLDEAAPLARHILDA